jgi:hypothetical protein
VGRVPARGEGERVRILKAGITQDWWVGKVGTCKFCHTEIEVEADDQVGRTFDRDSDLASVECPNCKAAIWVYHRQSEVGRG